MAKSFDKMDNSPAISDDMIKEALKTGLSSIAASDELVKKTLDKCQDQITNGKQSYKAGKSSIMPWVYKLGAPLAVGAMVLVLVFGGNQPFSKNKISESAPQASNSEFSQEASESGSAFKKDTLDEENARSASELHIQFSEEVAPSVEPATDAGSGEMLMYGFAADSDYAGLQTLNSLSNRTKNNVAGSPDDSMGVFNAIVSQYNSSNGTQLTLDEVSVTRVYTLLPGGVNSNLLSDAGSYKEILSNEGYWALPLKNVQGVIEKILSVNLLDDGNPNMTVSSEDLQVKLNQDEFLVSSEPAGDITSRGNQMIFDANSLVNKVKAEEYQSVSETIVVDVNYGSDFLVFVNADGQELAIPFFTTDNLFGLENKKIYARDELFKIISNDMQQ